MTRHLDLRAMSLSLLGRMGGIPGRRIAVFGDFCLDKYLYIDARRDELSVETGLTAYQAHAVRTFPGAGGTIVCNLRALGAQAAAIGIVGDDGEGYELLRGLDSVGADSSLMVRAQDRHTPTYIKPMRREGHGGEAEMSRIDIRDFSPTPRGLEDRLIDALTAAVREADAVIVIDQFLERGCAAITDRVRSAVADLGGRYGGKTFLADSRARAREFENVIVKCNRGEWRRATGLDPEAPQQGARALLVTAGEEGAYVVEGGAAVLVPGFRVEGPIDTVGAGDAMSAGFTLGMSLGASMAEAALLGNCVSSITVGQIGVTGTATPEAVRRRLTALCG